MSKRTIFYQRFAQSSRNANPDFSPVCDYPQPSPSPSGRGCREAAGDAEQGLTECILIDPHPAFGHPLPEGEGHALGIVAKIPVRNAR